MHVRRGRAADVESDHAATDALAEMVAETGEPGLRVWYPHRHVAFGRRDVQAAGYDRASAAVAGRGYSPVERGVGGRAVAFTGETLAVVVAEPATASAPAVDDRYERALDTLARTLGDQGVAVTRGEPPDSFCPGSHSLQTDGGKVAGLAQRVRRDVALVGGVVIVDDATGVASVLDPVYDALGVPFDPESVGSLAAAGGESDPERIRAALEAAFVADRPTTVRDVRDT